MLIACAIIHVAVISIGVPLLKRLAQLLERGSQILQLGVVLVSGFLLVVLAHTIQMWAWAISFVWLAALPDLQSALYFSIATYTTLGYGDVTLADEFAIYGTFGAVTGLLTFGISTAFLVALASRLLPELTDIDE